jgi:phosphoribosylglycinamide formyltransferase-1
VHFVSHDLDAGPVIIQGQVSVLKQDSAQTLAARVHEVEHRIYPEAVRWFASGRLALKDGIALLDGKPLAR